MEYCNSSKNMFGQEQPPQQAAAAVAATEEVPVRDTDLIPLSSMMMEKRNQENRPCYCDQARQARGGGFNDYPSDYPQNSMYIPPPPDFTGKDNYQADLWELQFSRWWGWTWVRKNKVVEPLKPTHRPVEKRIYNSTLGNICRSLCCLGSVNLHCFKGGEDVYLTPTNSDVSSQIDTQPRKSSTERKSKPKAKPKIQECADVGLQVRCPHENGPVQNKHQRYHENLCRAHSWVVKENLSSTTSNEESCCCPNCAMDRFDSSTDESLDYLNDRLHNVQCQDVCCPCLRRNNFFGCSNPPPCCMCCNNCHPCCVPPPCCRKEKKCVKPKPIKHITTQTCHNDIKEISTNTTQQKKHLCKCKKRVHCCPCCARPIYCPYMYKCVSPYIKQFKKCIHKENPPDENKSHYCKNRPPKCSKSCENNYKKKDVQRDYNFEIIKNKVGLDLLKMMNDKTKMKSFPNFKKFDDGSLVDEILHDWDITHHPNNRNQYYTSLFDSSGQFKSPLTGQTYNCNLLNNSMTGLGRNTNYYEGRKFDFLTPNAHRSIYTSDDKLIDLKTCSLKTGDRSHMDLVNSICDAILYNQKRENYVSRNKNCFYKYEDCPQRDYNYSTTPFKFDNLKLDLNSTTTTSSKPTPKFCFNNNNNFTPPPIFKPSSFSKNDNNFNNYDQLYQLRSFLKTNSVSKIDKTLRTVAGMSKKIGKRRRNLNPPNKKNKLKEPNGSFYEDNLIDTSSNTSEEFVGTTKSKILPKKPVKKQENYSYMADITNKIVDNALNNNNNNTENEIVLSNFNYDCEFQISNNQDDSNMSKLLKEILNDDNTELKNQSVLSIIKEESEGGNTASSLIDSSMSPINLAEKLFNNTNSTTSYDKIFNSNNIYTNTSLPQINFKRSTLDTSVSPFKIRGNENEKNNFQKLYNPIDVNTSPFNFNNNNNLLESSTSTSGISKKKHPFGFLCLSRNDHQCSSPYKLSESLKNDDNDNNRNKTELPVGRKYCI